MSLVQTLAILSITIGAILLANYYFRRFRPHSKALAELKDDMVRAEAVVYYEHERQEDKLIQTNREVWHISDDFNLNSLPNRGEPTAYQIKIADHVFCGEALICIYRDSGASTIYVHSGRIRRDVLTIKEARKLSQQIA